MTQQAMVRYGAMNSKSTGYRNDAGLTLGDVRRYAPSILTLDAAPDRSDKYVAIPTFEMIAGLRETGFRTVEVRQNRVRLANKREFARHMIRMRHVGGRTVAGAAHEVMLLNAHDGTSSFTLIDGWFRFVCSNGMISGDINSFVRIQHRGDAVARAKEEATKLIDRARESSRRIEAMRQRILTPAEYTRLAEEAARIRWGQQLPVHPRALLQARRWEDRGDDLWTVLNRIQENVIKGGTPGRAATGRNLTTRAITSIDEDVRINAGLWQAADALLEA